MKTFFIDQNPNGNYNVNYKAGTDKAPNVKMRQVGREFSHELATESPRKLKLKIERLTKQIRGRKTNELNSYLLQSATLFLDYLSPF